MIRYCLLLLPLLLGACGNHSGKSGSAGSGGSTQAGEAPTGNFYKRYSGSIAGKPVVVQLQRYAGAIQGAYQYTAVGRVIGLYSRTDTVLADGQYILYEMVADGGGEDAASDAQLMLTLSGDKAGGEWRSGDGTRSYPISLTEEYPAGSVRLDAFYAADSAELLSGKPGSPKAVATYSYLLPAEDAAGFLYESLRHAVSPTGKGTDVAAAIRADNEAYFEDYRKENASLINEDSAANESFAFSFTSDEVVSVLHNDGGWLVMQSMNASYTGGAHGNYGSSFANIDVTGSREWRLTDMIADTAALRPMLNDAAIAYFRLKPGEGMDQRMLVDEVPVTDNVYLSATGLTFVYNPYEIASYADGQVALFLPYKKLLRYLTPAFKSRMHLTGNAGMAQLSARHAISKI